jgi:hypothetical protein
MPKWWKSVTLTVGGVAFIILLFHAFEARRRRRRYVMSGDLRDKHILDTSAWNALLDDPKQQFILKKLRTKAVIPTALVISEIAAEPKQERRYALLRLVKKVGRDIRPLDMPNQLVIRACQGYARRDAALTLNDGGEAQSAWIAINDPKLVDAEAQRMAIGFNQERENSFRRMNELLRKDLQSLFKTGVARPPSMGTLIRHYSRNDDFLYGVVNPIYERAVGKVLPRDELRPLLDSLPHWPMFLMGYACAIYQRAVKEQGFGHKNNPGNLDLWSATYLPSCDTFVTNDTRQRRALKVINKGNTCPARIVSYAKWRERLLKP